jgi:hypothetical protein
LTRRDKGGRTAGQKYRPPNQWLAAQHAFSEVAQLQLQKCLPSLRVHARHGAGIMSAVEFIFVKSAEQTFVPNTIEPRGATNDLEI